MRCTGISIHAPAAVQVVQEYGGCHAILVVCRFGMDDVALRESAAIQKAEALHDHSDDAVEWT